MNENIQPRGTGGEITIWGAIKLLLSKFYLLLIAAVAVGLAVFLVLNFFVTPIYESRVSFYVYNSSDSTVYSSTINNNDLQAAESLAMTYSKILESNSVLDAVLEDLGGEGDITRKDIDDMIRVSVVTDTQLLEVVTASADAQFACDVARSFANVAPDEIVRITKAGGVEVVDQPETAAEKSSPRTLFDTVIGAFIGFVIAAIIIILKAKSDTTIYLPEDIGELMGLTVLGQIPEIAVPETKYNYWNVVKGGVVCLEEKEEKKDEKDSDR